MSEGQGRMREVAVQALDAARLEPLIGAQRMAEYRAEAAEARRLLAGRSVTNVNSTAAGGGVAELLQSLLAYARGAGIDARWQVSRWDRLKDMAGVMTAFAEHVDPALGAHLLLAGPVVSGVADDPEGGAVLQECIDRWRRLPHHARSRVHLACMPMADPDEQAAIVNALQRHATIVVQKSLAEGFGLTVSEAMWKQRPVVGSAVGGIADQIRDGQDGLLLPDPRDLAACGAAIERLLRDPLAAARLARNARTHVTEEFLGDRHLERYARLFAQLGTASANATPAPTTPRR